MAYWDSSAITKLYLNEPTSPVFEQLAVRLPTSVTSPLGQFETVLAIRRHQADGKLSRIEADQLVDELLVDITGGMFDIVAADFDLFAEFQTVVQRCFQGPLPISIRTLDALHIAAALSAGETEFVSNDIRQRTAAVALGMSVLP